MTLVVNGLLSMKYPVSAIHVFMYRYLTSVIAQYYESASGDVSRYFVINHNVRY